MWKHEVMDQLHNVYTRENVTQAGVDFGMLETAQKVIPNSVSIHLGHRGDISDVLKVDGKTMLFADDNLVLPYDNCWFDYRAGDGTDTLAPGKQLSTRRGVLVWKAALRKVYYVIIFSHIDSFRGWVPSPIVYGVNLDPDVSEKDLHSKAFVRVAANKNLYASVFFNPETVGPAGMMGILVEDAEELSVLNMAMLLFACKNIYLDDVPRPAKLNKKRIKNGKPPLLKYKVLKVRLPAQRRKDAPGIGGGNKGVPIHLCRGHFKEYTKEAPLFGRLTGRYWWQPTVRGNKKHGVIHKDYEVVTGETL